MGPTFSPCPRPILKRPSTVPDVPSVPRERDEPTELLAIDRGILQPVVRFPARPALSKTFSAHSSAQYDRSPIVVQPNSCALPARGCPGRTYNLDDPTPRSPRASSSRVRSPSRAGRHLHPRATSALPIEEDDDPTPRASPHLPLPALVPDLSSESDESDGFTSPPNELVVAGRPPLRLPRVPLTELVSSARCPPAQREGRRRLPRYGLRVHAPLPVRGPRVPAPPAVATARVRRGQRAPARNGRALRAPCAHRQRRGEPDS